MDVWWWWRHRRRQHQPCHDNDDGKQEKRWRKEKINKNEQIAKESEEHCICVATYFNIWTWLQLWWFTNKHHKQSSHWLYIGLQFDFLFAKNTHNLIKWNWWFLNNGTRFWLTATTKQADFKLCASIRKWEIAMICYFILCSFLPSCVFFLLEFIELNSKWDLNYVITKLVGCTVSHFIQIAPWKEVELIELLNRIYWILQNIGNGLCFFFVHFPLDRNLSNEIHTNEHSPVFSP